MTKGSSKEYLKEWKRRDRAKNPDKYRMANRKYYSRNRERCSWIWKKYKYRITKQEFEALLTIQDNICPICNRELDGRIVIDHDHYYKELTGNTLVRGILHESCNIWVGYLETHIRLLKSTLDYLRRADAKKEKGV